MGCAFSPRRSGDKNPGRVRHDKDLLNVYNVHGSMTAEPGPGQYTEAIVVDYHAPTPEALTEIIKAVADAYAAGDTIIIRCGSGAWPHRLHRGLPAEPLAYREHILASFQRLKSYDTRDAFGVHPEVGSYLQRGRAAAHSARRSCYCAWAV